jgi:hypothetical protein
MTLDITFMPMGVLIDGHDTYGNLNLSDGQLAAMIVRLDSKHHGADHKGLWHLEAGFGKCNVRDAPLFKTPEEAGAWVEQILTRNALDETSQGSRTEPGHDSVGALGPRDGQ